MKCKAVNCLSKCHCDPLLTAPTFVCPSKPGVKANFDKRQTKGELQVPMESLSKFAIIANYDLSTNNLNMLHSQSVGPWSFRTTSHEKIAANVCKHSTAP